MDKTDLFKINNLV